MNNTEPRQTILIVDDVPENIDVMAGILNHDYTVRAATSGDMALKAVHSQPVPDLIILDVIMPGMDGFEVCRRLKSDNGTKRIPVIFVTAKDDVSDESAGFAAGGIDYITKPIQAVVVKARVQTHLQLKIYQDQLEKLVRERTAELEMEIIERKRTELTLRESEKKLIQSYSEINLILNSITSILIGVSREDIITHWNRIAEETFHTPATDALGKNITKITIDWDWKNIYLGISTCISENRPVSLSDVKYTDRNGKPGLLGIVINPVKNLQNGLIGFLINGKDITEKRSMEAQLIHAGRMASIGQLATGVAHELNQPLNVIGLCGQLILRGYDKNDITDEFIKGRTEKILKQLERASTIINHLRIFGRKDPINISEIDANEPVREALSMLKEQMANHGIVVNINLNSNLPRIMGDSNQLEQVFINLLTNARDALDDIIEPGYNKIITASSYHEQSDNMIHITVSNNGKSIPGDVIDRIFEPFFTTKDIGKGTGLGLSISYGIIQSHKGSIQVISENNTTSFTVKIPASQTVSETR